MTAGAGGIETSAVVVRDATSPAVIEPVVAADPRADEVRVQIIANGICGTDLKAMIGVAANIRFPLAVGHEAAGVVTDVGPGASGLRAGDHVVLTLYGPCLTCTYCAQGRFNLCDGSARARASAGQLADGSTSLRGLDGEQIHPHVGVGGLSGYAVVRASQAVKIPDHLPLDVMCLAGCGVSTGMGAVFNVAEVRPGDRVAVIGCGGVGLNVIQACRVSGAADIIAFDPNPLRRGFATTAGATQTADPDVLGGIGPAMRELCPRGVDVAFEVVGLPDLVADAVGAVRPGGTVVMIGAPPADAIIGIRPRDLINQRRLLGCRQGNIIPSRDIGRIVDLYERGLIDLDSMVTTRRPLEEYAEAIAETRRGEVARAVVVHGMAKE